MKDVIEKTSFPLKGAKQDTIARADKGVSAGKMNTMEPKPMAQTDHNARISREVMTKSHPTGHSRRGC